jgi:hypothetical protein
MTLFAVVLTILCLAVLAYAVVKIKAVPGMMAALSADRQTQTKERGLKAYPVKASTKIYDGSLVGVDSNGAALPAANASALRVVGVARGQADNSSGAVGDLWVKVESPIVARFAASSITQAMLGQMMYVVDDQTFDDAKGTYGTKAGILVEYISTTEGWILVRESGPGAVVADADATYGQPEADLINEIKGILNNYVA